MKNFRFDPGQTFREVRGMLNELSSLQHKDQIAKLIWLEGSSAGEYLTYLWDPLAERFGHNIDKEPIDSEIVANLINDIAVEVKVVKPKPVARKR